jgi:hypothetical protein
LSEKAENNFVKVPTASAQNESAKKVFLGEKTAIMLSKAVVFLWFIHCVIDIGSARPV